MHSNSFENALVFRNPPLGMVIIKLTCVEQLRIVIHNIRTVACGQIHILLPSYCVGIMALSKIIEGLLQDVVETNPHSPPRAKSNINILTYLQIKWNGSMDAMEFAAKWDSTDH